MFALFYLCAKGGEVSSGVFSLPTSKCFVSTRGGVRIQGEKRPDVQYRVVPRRGQAWIYSKIVAPGLTKIWVKFSDDEALADLELRVPRSLDAITVETSEGDVEAIDFDGGLGARTTAGRVFLDRIAGPAAVKSGGGEIRVGRLGSSLKCYLGAGSITVDSAGESYIETHGGEIVFREARGPLTARSAGGNIRVSEAADSVDVSTGGGVIDVFRAAGPVTAVTGGGSIQIGSATGVKAETGTGAIRLKSVGGPIDARTGNGTVLLDLTGDSPLESSFLRTALGDVVVLIPSNKALTVEAVNLFGNRPARIFSDFGAIRVFPRTSGGTRAVAAEGHLSGGGPLLKVEAAGGTIQFREQQ